MKRWLILFVGLLLVGNVLAASAPSGYESAGDDAEKAKELIEQMRDVELISSKAEDRIRGLNVWLDDHVGWMRYIFHMKPALSMLFIINVYIILCFFVFLFLNAEGVWFFIDKKRARVFGFGVFLILLVVRLYYGLAVVVNNWLGYLWNVVLPSGLLGMLLFLALVLILGIFGIPLVGSLGRVFYEYRKAKEARREKMELHTTNAAMNALINQVGRTGN